MEWKKMSDEEAREMGQRIVYVLAEKLFYFLCRFSWFRNKVNDAIKEDGIIIVR